MCGWRSSLPWKKQDLEKSAAYGNSLCGERPKGESREEKGNEMSTSSERNMMSQWRVSRRAVVTAGAGTVMIGVLSPLLAACGGSSATKTPASTTGSGSSGSATGTSAPAATAAQGNPVSGGTLILGYNEPPTMDPRVSGATIAWRLFYNIFDPLVVQAENGGGFVQGLATKWEVEADGKAYTFTLRTGVKFHDGTDFNADAVKYTFDSILDPALKSLTAIGYLGPYSGTDVVDAQTVKVNFTDPYAPFLNNLSHSVLSPVSPTAAKNAGPDGFGQNPVGTGPFKFKEWKQKISMTLAKNPDYNWPTGVYKHTGAAYLDEIQLKFITEATVRAGTLTSGESTVIDGVLPQDVKKLKADPKFQVFLPSVPGSPQILPMNGTKPPTDDVNVRKAIIQAIDMDTVVNTLWFGTRKTAKGPLSSPTWSYDPKVETMYPFDKAKAEQILDDAGWKKGSGGVREKDGQQLSVSYITVTGIQGQAAELVQSYLTDVGFKVDLQELEYAATAADYLASKHNIARIYFSHTDPVVLTTLYHSKNIQGTNFNRTMKPRPDLDKMLDDATAEMDMAKRKQDYVAIQEYIMNHALIIPLWEETVFWGASAKVKGIHFQPLGGIWFYDVWMEQ